MTAVIAARTNPEVKKETEADINFEKIKLNENLRGKNVILIEQKDALNQLGVLK